MERLIYTAIVLVTIVFLGMEIGDDKPQETELHVVACLEDDLMVEHIIPIPRGEDLENYAKGFCESIRRD